MYTEPNVEAVRLASGRPGLAVRTLHAPWWPCQVLVLDGASGAIVAEYLHAGHFGFLNVVDLDGDGANELVLGGINNRLQHAARPGHGSAVLAVLGTHEYRGRSPGVPEPDGLELPLGQEKAYVRFPLSDVGVQRLDALHGVCQVEVERFEDGRASVVAHVSDDVGCEPRPGGSVFFYGFDGRSLLPRGVAASSSFAWVHAALVREGKLESRLDEGYFRALEAGIRYWDGGQWLTPEERRLRLAAGEGEPGP
jgi:hypothetical protein